MKKDTYKNFEPLDTLMINIPYLIFGSLVIVYIFSIFKLIDTLSGQFEKLAGIIFLLFTSIKLIYYVGRPKVVYRNKTTKVTTEYF